MLESPSSRHISEREPGATFNAFRMTRADGNLSAPMLGVDYTVDLPATVLDALGLDEILGVTTVFDQPLLDPLVSMDVQGAFVQGQKGGLNLNLYDVRGAPLNVSGLREPIALGMPLNGSAVCAYWLETEERWAYDGFLEEVVGGDSGTFTCLTPHLTFFGAVVQGVVMTFSCAQLQLLTAEALLELLQGQWFFSPFALMYWLLLLVLAAMLAAAVKLDRASAHSWHDEFWLIPLSKPPSEEQRHESVSETPSGEEACSWACVVGFVKEHCISCSGSMLRDALDDIASRWFDNFGEVRTCCESLWDGVSHGGLAMRSVSRVFHSVMVSLVTNAARRHAAHALGLSMDMITHITADEDLGEILLEAACQDPDLPPDPRLQAWSSLHGEVLRQIDDHWHHPKHWWSLPLSALRVFLNANPLVALFHRCHFSTRAQRVLVFTCELLGALMLVSAFFEASGGTVSKRNRSRNCDIEGVAQRLGEIIAIATSSLLLASIPVIVLSSLHTRSFKKLPYRGCPEWTKQLRSWQVQDVLFWVVGFIYSLFCAFFVALFLANVDVQDHGPFGVSGATMLVQDTLAIPLAMALLLPMMTIASVQLAGWLDGKSRTELLEQGRRDKESEPGNWYQVVVPI